MSDDTTALQERIARAQSRCLTFEPDMCDGCQKRLDDAAVVIPIIRAAQAVAWDAGHEAGVEAEQGRDRLNPHRYQVEREG